MGHKKKFNSTNDRINTKIEGKEMKLSRNSTDEVFSTNVERKGKKSRSNVDDLEKKSKTNDSIDSIKLKNGTEKKLKTNDTEEKKQKSISFAEDVIDNENDEPPRKKNKKSKDDIVIKPTETPTEEELLECKKPENIKSIESKRHIKKMKHEKLKQDQKLKNELEIQQKNLNYLSLWKHNRNEWKFNKIQQVWLQKHMFDDKYILDDHFEILIEYFSGAKGQVRQTILKECTDIIEKDEGVDEIEDEAKKIKYKRARSMLQSLN